MRVPLLQGLQACTGLTFADYLWRVRVEKEQLLMDPHKRNSEAGFQSLSQFNRVFDRIAGGTPTHYREHPHRSHRVMSSAAALVCAA